MSTGDDLKSLQTFTPGFVYLILKYKSINLAAAGELAES